MLEYYDVWFSRVEISNKNKFKLLENFKSPENIWKAKENELYSIGLKKQTVNAIFDVNKKRKLDLYIKYMEENNIRLIKYDSSEYPRKLKQIDDPPLYLYVRGKIENIYGDIVAIIGSRNASKYGLETARNIGKELADRNINIVSGLALGIDKFAHLGSLDSTLGKAIAVLGTGVSNNEIYPKENQRLFERILETGGTIISEYPLGTKPLKYHFPLRNRIISGLADKVIVVEAKKNSGSLITVDYALDQGKDVFAVPGNINSENSEGTNNLLLEGAQIFTNINDIF